LVNRRHDARSVDDPGYTDTVREDFDRIADFEDVVHEQRREAQALLDEQVKRVEASGGTVNERHLREGRAEEEIVVLAEEIGAGMIVMGSRGRGRLRRALLGSVTDAVVRHAHCPVILLLDLDTSRM